MSYPDPPPLQQTTTGHAVQESTTRMIALAIMGGTVVIGVVIATILGVDSDNLLLVVLAVLLVAVGFVVAMSFGYRAPATPANGQSAYLATFFIRLVMTETPMLLNLVIGFIAQTGLAYLVALPFSVASMWVHLIPSDATQRRLAAGQKV